MKSLIVSLCISLALISCGSQSKTISAVSYVVAKNYFVKNTVENKLFEVKITSQDEFDSFFGIARTMGEGGKPTAINFDSEFVIAVINPISDDVSGVECKDLIMSGEKLVLDYSLAKTDKQSFESRHALILIVDKKLEAEVEFVNN
ncbi:hypothetical protein [Dysgonomonas massiliensis]|uniref:hypothetical protein n=1 Tax=Dysgonomonas massiliensis TaxID=2040292 RepID=UPI000C762518|nr:hypothetical protein [Dysgonomonas massiliensis]